MHKKEENILIFCRSLNDINLLSQIIPFKGLRYIVASDDVRVKEQVEKLSWIKETCWIELSESFYNVAEDVKKYILIINKWLKNLVKTTDKFADLLYWVSHVEGGYTTQRIQDSLLLIRSYKFLFEKYGCSKIIIVSSRFLFEDQILIHTALSNKVDIQTVKGGHLQYTIGKLYSLINIIGRDPFHISNILWVKYRNILRRNKKRKYNREIDIQLCSKNAKNLDNAINTLKAFELKDYDAVALCWQAFGAIKKIQKEKLNTQELEEYVSICSLVLSVTRILQLWIKANIRMRSFITLPELHYCAVPLGKILWDSIIFFLLAELGQRYRLMVAVEKYYNTHHPIAVRFVTTILPESTIVYSSLIRNKKEFIAFHQPSFPYDMENPYSHKAIPVDLELAMSKKHREKLLKDRLPSKQISLVGHDKLDTVSHFISNYTQKKSRSVLNLSQDYSIYIFYDPGFIVRGYLSVGEQVNLNESLLSFANNHPNVALIVKPHPGHKKGILDHQISSYSLENVFLIEKSIRPFHCLNAADVVITKWSTIAIEAMYFERPVISVILDNEKRFKIFGNAAHYIESIKELEKLFILFITNKNYMNEWTKDLNEKAKMHLSECFMITDKASTELSADLVSDLIESHNMSRMKCKPQSLLY